MKKYLFILLGAISCNLYANGCPGEFDPQSGICRFQGNNGELVQYNIAPPQSESSAPPKKIVQTTIIHKASKYGALALDKKTGELGDAVNANSLEEAKRVAIQQCTKTSKSKHCKVISWVKNGCIAAASGQVKGKWILYKAADEPNQVEKVAMNRCNAAGASGCKILVPEGCSVPEGMYN